MATASAKGVRAGRTFVEAWLDDSGIDKGLTKLRAKFSTWGKTLQGIGGTVATLGAIDIAKGALGLSALLAASKIFSDTGSQINDLAERTGLGTDAIQSMGYAAEQTGATIEDVEVGIKKLQVAIVGGSDAFGKLKLSADALKNKLPEEQIRIVAERMADVKNSADKTKIAVDLFGKSGTKLVGMLSELTALEKEAHEAGLIITPEQIKLADDLGDNIHKVYLQFKAFAVQVGAALAPKLKEFLGIVSENASSAIAWIKANSGLVVSLAKVLGISIALGAAQVALGGAISIVGLALKGIGLGFGLLGSVLSGAFTVVTALVSPLGLVAAGITALGVGLLFVGREGNRGVDTLKTAFADLKNIGVQSWQGIVDAVMSGDLELAGKIAWVGLKALWASGIGSLKLMWTDFVNFMATIWDGMVGTLALGITKVFGFINGVDTKQLEAEIFADNTRSKKERSAARDRQAAEIASGQSGVRDELSKLVEEASAKRAKQLSDASNSRPKPSVLAGLAGASDHGGSFSSIATRFLGAPSQKIEEMQLEELKEINKQTALAASLAKNASAIGVFI